MEKDTSFHGQNLGLPIDKVRILVNKNFLQANPVAQGLFEQIEIPIEDVNSQQKKVKNGENIPVDIRRHTEELIAIHQGLFNSWLEVALK